MMNLMKIKQCAMHGIALIIYGNVQINHNVLNTPRDVMAMNNARTTVMNKIARILFVQKTRQLQQRKKENIYMDISSCLSCQQSEIVLFVSVVHRHSVHCIMSGEQ